jgi:putative ABC transport system permease protein
MAEAQFNASPVSATRSPSKWIGSFRSIAFRLAWRNIARDRVRLGIAIVGVGFAVLLMTVQLGLLIGFATTSSGLIDHAQADIWIVPRGAKDVDQAGRLLERQQYLALGIPGVNAVESMVVRFAEWKRPDGGTESVIVVGLEPDSITSLPWNFIAGSRESLRYPDGVVIDELYAHKLGASKIGDIVEISNHRAKVTGTTSDVRTFTQSPYVFTSLANAKFLTGLTQADTTYLLVHAEPGTDLRELRNTLRRALPETDVWTAEAFSWQTRGYWLFTTGAGTALLIAALLGLVVGLVIVSQTLYSATVERMSEYATLRALGASNRYLKAIILRQSLISGTLGYSIGTVAGIAIAILAQKSSAALNVSSVLVLALAFVTLMMCIGASLISIRKVLGVDAATVFK